MDPTWFISDGSQSPELNFIQRFFMKLSRQQSIYEQYRSKFTIDYLRDNLARVIILILYILINIALALYVIIYQSVVANANVLFIIAHIAGMLLRFNCTLAIVLMLKHIILIIRSNKHLRKLIPVDDHIDFHKFVGRFIAALVIIHIIGHMANFGRLTGVTGEL